MSPADPSPRSTLASRQAEKLRRQLELVLEKNPFYRAKLRAAGLDLAERPGPVELQALPFTLKSELVADQGAHPPYGTNLTFPLVRYTRMHQTSGTSGNPLRWLDTSESWSWFVGCWVEVLKAAGATAEDRIFVAFSFGPFIGFWSGFEACQRLGALTLTGGALTTEQRLESLLGNEATVVLCTPTYAMRLAAVARELGHDLASSAVRLTIHAGEPGASVPNIKRRIEEAWGARAVDHAGATEVGAWGYGCGIENHVHINEDEFIAEVIDPKSQEAAPKGQDGAVRGELVMTNLGRFGTPVLRYRTGDLVEQVQGGCPCGRPFAFLRGGVLARIDDMWIVRGINVYPAAVENVVREIAQIDEFEVLLSHEREMAELVLRVEVASGSPEEATHSLAERLHRRLSLRPKVEVVPPGTLPRYELKARRFRRL